MDAHEGGGKGAKSSNPAGNFENKINTGTNNEL
jgi:hypothetical protein